MPSNVFKSQHLSNSMEFQDSSPPSNVFVFAGMSGLSSNFGMPVSMYSGQAAVAQTAMSMSSMPGGSSLFFCFKSILVYLLFVFVFSRHVSDVRHVGSRFSSHFSSDQFLPGIVCVFLVYCICVFHVHLLYLSISCVWNSFPGLFLPPRLRNAQLSHRGHDLVRLRPQVLFKVFLLLDKLKYISVFHDMYLDCFLSGKHKHVIMWQRFAAPTCPSKKLVARFRRRTQIERAGKCFSDNCSDFCRRWYRHDLYPNASLD